ncbi:hypothetical protein [Actinomyces ruminis]|uniref:Tetratricopeptide repeat-containing protein n=1 Tax=Actinomyces ruminis TaxID=1937003 RepID=A0ABX4MDR3_9ACTO|nr:hypothetical protein [Actinomyces ruminis]PHP53573.1 hypothetical protein BW737_001675 [Actinomyces ruminis]
MRLFRRTRNQDERRSAEAVERDDAVGTEVQAPPAQESLRERAAALTARLEEPADPEARIKLLNELGGVQQELGDNAAAIDSYEASMALREQFGPAYNGLLTLYNEQLKQAAKSRDDAAIQQWTVKLDELTALSKRVMRSQY